MQHLAKDPTPEGRPFPTNGQLKAYYSYLRSERTREGGLWKGPTWWRTPTMAGVEHTLSKVSAKRAEDDRRRRFELWPPSSKNLVCICDGQEEPTCEERCPSLMSHSFYSRCFEKTRDEWKGKNPSSCDGSWRQYGREIKRKRENNVVIKSILVFLCPQRSELLIHWFYYQCYAQLFHKKM